MISTLLKSVMLQTKISGKAGKKPGAKGRKKPAPGGPKGQGKKNPKKKPKKGANKNSDNTKDKEASKEKEKKTDEPCKLVTLESITFSHPSSHGSCGCGASTDNNVSSIPWSADWPVSFPLKSAAEYVLSMGLQLKTIVSRLSLKLGGTLAHCEDSYRKIGASEGHIDIIRNS